MKTLATLILLMTLAAPELSAQQEATAGANPRDSLLNGALIGAGVGAAAAVGFLRINCGPFGSDPECAAIVNLVGFGTFVPAGAVLGALIDRAIGNNRISVAPMIGPGGMAVTATVTIPSRRPFTSRRSP